MQRMLGRADHEKVRYPIFYPGPLSRGENAEIWKNIYAGILK